HVRSCAFGRGAGRPAFGQTAWRHTPVSPSEQGHSTGIASWAVGLVVRLAEARGADSANGVAALVSLGHTAAAAVRLDAGTTTTNRVLVIPVAAPGPRSPGCGDRDSAVPVIGPRNPGCRDRDSAVPAPGP